MTAPEEPFQGSPGGGALLALAFVAETGLLAGLFWVGWSLGTSTVWSWVLGFLLAGAVAVVWGLWCAPRARRRFPNPARAILKSILFLGMFALLVAFAPRPAGTVFGLGVLVLFAVSLPADREPAERT